MYELNESELTAIAGGDAAQDEQFRRQANEILSGLADEGYNVA
jgi:hypothetical protein